MLLSNPGPRGAGVACCLGLAVCASSQSHGQVLRAPLTWGEESRAVGVCRYARVQW
jgi:hypothetical protein